MKQQIFPQKNFSTIFIFHTTSLLLLLIPHHQLQLINTTLDRCKWVKEWFYEMLAKFSHLSLWEQESLPACQWLKDCGTEGRDHNYSNSCLDYCLFILWVSLRVPSCSKYTCSSLYPKKFPKPSVPLMSQ